MIFLSCCVTVCTVFDPAVGLTWFVHRYEPGLVFRADAPFCRDYTEEVRDLRQARLPAMRPLQAVRLSQSTQSLLFICSQPSTDSHRSSGKPPSGLSDNHKRLTFSDWEAEQSFFDFDPKSESESESLAEESELPKQTTRK